MKFPKPVKKPKAPRRPIQRRRAKRNRRPTTASFAFPRPETPAGGKERRSAHSRRTRAWGKMAFLRTRGCDVRGALISLAQEAPVGEEMDRWVTALEALPPCRGGTQVMHLGWKADPGGRRQAHDADTAGGCEHHHAEMGTKLGGLGPWYVGLGREGQRILRRRLQDRGQAAWDALTPEERAEWDRRAEADRTPDGPLVMSQARLRSINALHGGQKVPGYEVILRATGPLPDVQRAPTEGWKDG